MSSDSLESGDPDGRLIAARQAETLAEAGRVAEVLQVLLRRAGVADSVRLNEILTAIKRMEAANLRRAHGAIGGRRRLKRRGGSGNPLRDGLSRNYLHLDESGLSGRSRSAQDTFILAGVAMGEAQRAAYIRAATDLKRRFLNDESVTFHARDLWRGTGRFGFGGDAGVLSRFRDEVAGLIYDADFTAFGVGVRKRAYEHEFLEAGIDPYLPVDAYPLAIHLLLERYVDFLWASRQQPLGELILEAQGPREDVERQLAIADTILHGTQWVAGVAFQSHLLPGASFLPKAGSHPLELSDLLAYDLHQWARSGCVGEPGYWRIWSPKFYRREDLRMGKFGLKIFPDSDIRPMIEAHRDMLRDSAGHATLGEQDDD